MTSPSEEGFRVTDRRRRDTIEAPKPSEMPHPSAERSLVALFMMLGTEALIALGDAPDPVTGQQQRELPHASAIIDLLTLLRDKTEGHRSAEETRTLDHLVYDLQLRYVEAVKTSR